MDVKTLSGGDGKMAAHFRGELAGLSVVKGMMESEQVIQCLSDCQEKLDFHDMADLQAGMVRDIVVIMTRAAKCVGIINGNLYPLPLASCILSNQIRNVY